MSEELESPQMKMKLNFHFDKIKVFAVTSVCIGSEVEHSRPHIEKIVLNESEAQSYVYTKLHEFASFHNIESERINITSMMVIDKYGANGIRFNIEQVIVNISCMC